MTTPSPRLNSTSAFVVLALLVPSLMWGCREAAPVDSGLPDASPVPDAAVELIDDGGERRDAGVEDLAHATCVSSQLALTVTTRPDAGYTLYRCSEDQRSPLVAQLSGPHETSELSRVRALRQQLTDDELLAIPGIIGISTSTCCGIAAGPACLSLMLQTHTTPAEEVIDRVTSRLRELEAGCLGVQLELEGLEEPRCDLDACGPVTYCSAAHVGSPCCPREVTYDPTGPRLPLLNLPAELEQGVCSHDGECFANGVGNHCTSWQVPGFFAPSVCSVGLALAHCGCVDGSCRWFNQE